MGKAVLMVAGVLGLLVVIVYAVVDLVPALLNSMEIGDLRDNGLLVLDKCEQAVADPALASDARDSFGHPILVYRRDSSVLVISTGSDGALDVDLGDYWTSLECGMNTNPSSDIVCRDGLLLRWPPASGDSAKRFSDASICDR